MNAPARASRERLGARSIRPADPADLDALEALEEAVFASDRADRRAFRHAMRSPSMTLLVAQDEGGLLGYAMMERRRGSSLVRLTSIAVRPESAGAGLGRHLLAAAEADAMSHGGERLRLEVRADNAPAQRLYDRAGYRRFAVVEAYYEDGGAAWRYDKTLNPPAPRSPRPRP